MRGVNAEIAKFDRDVPIERAWMPPSSWYTNSSIEKHERSAVFGRNWLPVVRAEQVSQPGSMVAGCVAGEPWLITRDESGVLRAMHNVCRHKGNVLAEGRSETHAEIVCGYHGWTYGLDGRLIRAPRIAGVEEFDRSAMSLAPMAVAQWGPWLWISADADAVWPAASLSALDSMFENSGWQTLTYSRSLAWELRCNWKVYVDNYLDGGYHIDSIHPGLAAELDGARYKTTLGTGYSLQEAPPSLVPTSAQAGQPTVSNRIGTGALYAFVYPNFMINRYGDCLEGNFVTPLGVDRCRVEYDFFFAPGCDSESIESSLASSREIQEQDIAVSEAVQVGLSSRGFDRGRYAPRVEQAEHHFHCALARDLQRSPPTDLW